jgi:hypothetical protein
VKPEKTPLEKQEAKTYGCMMKLVDRGVSADVAEKSCSNIFNRRQK